MERKLRAAREVIDILQEISLLLVIALLLVTSKVSPLIALQNTGLDRNTLSICVSLIETGVNPEALASVIQELRKEGERVRAQGRVRDA